ncbi:hypothetical protein Hanom_Chr07g00591931 [Helianthus anomalus]
MSTRTVLSVYDDERRQTTHLKKQIKSAFKWNVIPSRNRFLLSRSNHHVKVQQ